MMLLRDFGVYCPVIQKCIVTSSCRGNVWTIRRKTCFRHKAAGSNRVKRKTRSGQHATENKTDLRHCALAVADETTSVMCRAEAPPCEGELGAVCRRNGASYLVSATSASGA